MPSLPIDPTPPLPGMPARRPYRPPLGIPGMREPRSRATVASILLHAALFVALVAPTLFVSRHLAEMVQGGGGPGPAGGGGGGNRGTGGEPRLRFIRERVDYVKVGEAPTPKVEVPKPEVPKPVEPPPPPPPEPEVQKDVATAVADSGAGAVAGRAGGSGADGSAGAGPGSGGGVGSGIGTGRGSSTGPGTGGGDGTVYPPTVVALPILPLPIPARVRPYRMQAEFEVDTLGNARLLGFNPSRDAGYNRRVREMLLEIRFRPAVTADGRPVRAIAVVTAEAM